MNLNEQLENDLKEAMKSHDKDTLLTLRMVKGDLQLEKINRKREINDDLIIEVISRGIKTRNESIKEFEKGSREDLITQTRKEIEILKHYLPEPLSDEELIAIIDTVFKEVQPEGMKDMGKVMKEVGVKVKGRVDMGKVSSIIKDKLA